VVSVTEPTGRHRRWHLYDLDQLDAAHALYREMRATPPAPRMENAATRSGDRFDDAWRARDWERFTACLAPTYLESARRRMVLLDLDRGQVLEGLRLGFDMDVSSRTRELLATRGDRLALFRMHWELAHRSIGPSEIEWLDLIEVDDQGNRIAGVTFDA